MNNGALRIDLRRDWSKWADEALPQNDTDNRIFVAELKQAVRHLEAELYRVQAERDRLREPISEEESRSIEHMYGKEGVRAVSAFIAYRSARAKESSNG